MEEEYQVAKRIISQIIYLNLATITPEGQPWNTPVYFAYDQELNFYWISWTKNQHSINVKQNSSSFVTIYDSTAPADTGLGVYFQGKASQITSVKEMLHALKPLYLRRDKKMRSVKQFMQKFPRRIYKFIPERVWINGEGDINGNFIDVRMELDLKKLVKVINESS